jgi:hypothetical protein
MLGKQVIVRTYSAGVHFGTLSERDGREVLLKDARRLWYWEGAFTLSAVSQEGVKKSSKLSVAVPEILLTEAIEIIPCSEKAAKNLSSLEAHEV